MNFARSVVNKRNVLYIWMKLTRKKMRDKWILRERFSNTTTASPSKCDYRDLIACATRIILIRHFMEFYCFVLWCVSPRLYRSLFTVSIVAIANRLNDFSTLRFGRLINCFTIFFFFKFSRRLISIWVRCEDEWMFTEQKTRIDYKIVFAVPCAS